MSIAIELGLTWARVRIGRPGALYRVELALGLWAFSAYAPLLGDVEARWHPSALPEVVWDRWRDVRVDHRLRTERRAALGL